ncbi:hypothetical protein GCM10023178_28710 [Actinomadura luteofluorescens]
MWHSSLRSSPWRQWYQPGVPREIDVPDSRLPSPVSMTENGALPAATVDTV